MPPNLLDLNTPLKEVVTQANIAFRKCRQVAQDPGRTDFPSLFLHCSMIHMANGIDCLISSSCFAPTHSLARSMLESWFYLKYIHEENYEQRSLSWLCAYYHEQIKYKNLVDPTSDAGKKLRETLKNEVREWRVYQPSDIEKFNETRDYLLNELRQPEMRPIEEEFKELKKKWGRVPKWYEMFNKKMKLRDLAEYVGLEGFYALFYGPWSRTTHNSDAVSLVSIQQDGSAEFKELNETTGFKKIDPGVRIFLVEGTVLMVDHFLKPKD